MQARGEPPGTELDFDLTDELSESVWEIARKCWKPEPETRPDAAELVRLMGDINALANPEPNDKNLELNQPEPTPSSEKTHVSKLRLVGSFGSFLLLLLAISLALSGSFWLI